MALRADSRKCDERCGKAVISPGPARAPTGLLLRLGGEVEGDALRWERHSLPLDPDVAGIARELQSGMTGEALELRLGELEPMAAAAARYHLRVWEQQRLLRRCVVVQGLREPVVETLPLGDGLPTATIPPEGGRWGFSRLAHHRQLDDRWSMESPESPLSLRMPASLAAPLISAMASGCDADGLDAACSWPAGTGRLVLSELVAAGVAVPLGTGAADDSTSGAWSFPDLLFHARSRERGPHGATYPLAGDPPPPAIRPGHGGPRVPLETPDLAARRRSDPPLQRVLDERRSRRSPGLAPTRLQLGELLYRAARSDAPRPDPGPHPEYQITRRPYPSGGASHALEVYVAAHACADLERGIYHYEPDRHALCCLKRPCREFDALLRRAAASTGRDGTPQVLLVLTARFARTSWKYEGSSYSLILKEVGVLFQTFYLLAEAMGLPACALGSGNADLFAEATGIDYLVEGSVGEFILGGLQP